MKASQYSGDLYWIKPWIETFWSNYSGTQYWLTGPQYFSTCGRCSTNDQKAPQHLENHFAMKASPCSSHLYWIKPWIHTYLLIELKWHTVLTDKIWIPFHMRKMLYQGPEGSSTPRKSVSPWRQVNVLAIYTESNHEYRLSDPTTVVRSTDWLDLNIFPPAEDVLPKTRRLLDTWKTGFAIKESQCSGHSESNHEYRQTFWSNCSGTQCWLTRPEHLSTCGRCSNKYQKTPQHLEKMVSPWRQFNVLAILLDHTMNTHLLSPLQWHTVLTVSTRIPANPWRQSGLVWFSINGQNIDSPWWQNRFFRCWGAFCFLVANVS